ncbi:hypothetical protein [Blautia massiliensis (ex Durand et al. 2017)]
MSNAKTVVKRKRGDWQIAVLFLLPSLILLGLFVFLANGRFHPHVIL